ncbi:MAG TPA: flagellar export protein FliJ [bacterium]
MRQNAKFRLQKVLEVREIIEKERQKELSQSTRKLKTAEDNLSQLQEKKLQVAQAIGALKKIEVNQFAHYYGYLTSLRTAVSNKLREIAAIKKDVENKRQALLEATKNRKALENLKSRHQQEVADASLKTEQAAIDDVAIRKSFTKPNFG